MKAAPAALCAALTLLAGGAAAAQAAPQRPEEPQPVKTIAVVIEENADRLLALPGVVGLAEGVCDGRPCVRLLVERRTPELDARTPAVLEGYPVVVQETGRLRPMAPAQGR